jgi:DNA processing protein
MNRLEDARAHAAALAGLPGMTPVRLARLLDGFHPELAWKTVRAGARPADPQRKFAKPARMTDVREVWDGYVRREVKVLLPDGAGYPPMLVGDPGAPAVLFALGDPTILENVPRVAIVGTRSATHYGRQVASELAGELAAEGVIVVSGLARGIDAAAHAGVVRADHGASAPPVAVVGTGLDVVYPRSNRELWDEVTARGAVLSESALGTKPHPGVFPARNRIIAALSDVVVVVESHHGGGSLYTADAAARRSIPVCAVPGSVMSRASGGTNALLVDGCTPVRDAADVLVAISLARTGKDEALSEIRALRSGSALDRPDSGIPTELPLEANPPGAARPPIPPPKVKMQATSTDLRQRGVRARRGPPLSAQQCAVWEAVDDVPTTFETILIRTDLSIAAAAEACDSLVERGALLAGSGWWSHAPEQIKWQQESRTS